MKTIKQKTSELIETQPAWGNGDSETVWQKKSATIAIEAGAGRDQEGYLFLRFYYRGKMQSQVKCGFFSPRRGWVKIIEESDYVKFGEDVRNFIRLLKKH